MRKFAFALAIALVPLGGYAQEKAAAKPTVTIKAAGDDVRKVLSSIFDQAKKQYVLPANFHFALYMSLENTDFEKALTIVCKQTGLEFVVEDDIYQVRVAPKKVAEPAPQTTAIPEAAKTKDAPAEKTEPPKRNVLSTTVLTRRLSTRLQKTDLRTVMSVISEQTKVPIEVHADVPAYLLDAFLIKTSLKYALDRITSAANLDYRFTDRGTILIEPKRA